MGSDIFGALFASVSGLDAQSTNLSIIANNISNANTIGYKAAQAEFLTLVSGAGSSTNFASGGVKADNRQLIDGQGLLQSTSSATDLAIQGNGLFVVNSKANDTGQVLYTRAGSFTQDSSGNFVNAAGYFLQAWPLDTSGRLPGAPGNTTNTTSSANLTSLETVNVQNVAGKAEPTTNVSLSANLNASQTAYPGASDTVTMDSNNNTDSGITANEIILPDPPPAGGSGVDSLVQGDTMKITTSANSVGYVYTYGGIAYTRNITTGAADGNSGTALSSANNVALAAQPFTFTAGSNVVTINHAPPAGLAAGDLVKISGNTTAFDGLAAGALDGSFYVQSVGVGSFTIILPSSITPPATTALAANSVTTVSSGGNTVTINGTPPTGLAVGDVVTIAGSGAILDSAGNQMYSAAQMNTTHTVTAVGGGSYTISMAAPAGGGTQATGDISFEANPANGDTISINGQTWTFVSGAAVGNQTHIGANLNATLNQLATDLTASNNASLTVANYAASPASPNSTQLNITYKTGTVNGNAYTLGTPTVASVNLGGGIDAVSATGSITFGVTPSVNDTIVLNGTTWTFVADVGQTNAALSAAHQLKIDVGNSLPNTMTDAAAVLNVTPFGGATYSYSGTANAIDITDAASDGTNGNSYTLATGTGAGNETLSGGTLTGGVDGVAATGSIPITTNPSVGQTIIVGGQTWTFVASGAAGNQTNIGVNLAATLTQLATDLNASANTNTNATFSGASGNSLAITYNTTGVAGNAYAFSAGVIPGPSGANLTGGATTTNSGGSSTQGGNAVTEFVTTGGTNGAVVSERLFTGDILDATSPTDTLITTPSNFTSAALSFTISVGTTASTFLYTPAAPNAALGEFSTLDNLATAISDVPGLTARVVNNQLYISAVDGNKAITFANGSTTGTNTSPPLAGIDWVGELGLGNISSFVGHGRFSTMQGLANLVNADSGLTARVNNPLGAASVKINVDSPLDTITFADGAGNTGSLLGELGLATSLNGQPFTTPQTATFQQAYLPTDSTKNMASGSIIPQFSRSITVYDSLGAPHNLNVAFINTGINEWAAEVYVQPPSDINQASLDGTSGASNTGLVAAGTLTFNGDGSLGSVGVGLSSAIPIQWGNGAQASSVTIDWGTAGAIGTGKTNGMSQFSSPFSVNFVNQNGAQVGSLTGVSISSTGLVTVSFSNGQTQNLYQIPLAIFSDPDQLQSISGNVFSETASSGQVNLQQAGGADVGTIASSALEQSNVALADQLTTMIVAQQAYQANTKVIATSDTLLQALDQIIQ